MSSFTSRKKIGPGIEFLQKIPKHAFCKLFFGRYTIVFYVNESFCLRVLCISAKVAKAKLSESVRYARQILEKTTDPAQHYKKFSLPCARQDCKSKIFSALRAPDARENG